MYPVYRLIIKEFMYITTETSNSTFIATEVALRPLIFRKF